MFAMGTFFLLNACATCSYEPGLEKVKLETCKIIARLA